MNVTQWIFMYLRWRTTATRASTEQKRQKNRRGGGKVTLIRTLWHPWCDNNGNSFQSSRHKTNKCRHTHTLILLGEKKTISIKIILHKASSFKYAIWKPLRGEYAIPAFSSGEISLFKVCFSKVLLWPSFSSAQWDLLKMYHRWCLPRTPFKSHCWHSWAPRMKTHTGDERKYRKADTWW